MSKEKTTAKSILDKVIVALGLEKEPFKLSQIKAEGKIELAQVKTDKGVVLEAEVFEAGQSVGIVQEEGIVALPVGDYTLEDGSVLVVREEGIIAEIKAAGETEAATDEDKELTDKVKKVVESVSKETFFSKQDGESLLEAVTKLTEHIEASIKNGEETETTESVELSKPPKSIKPNPEQKERKVINYTNGETSNTRIENILRK